MTLIFNCTLLRGCSWYSEACNKTYWDKLVLFLVAGNLYKLPYYPHSLPSLTSRYFPEVRKWLYELNANALLLSVLSIRKHILKSSHLPQEASQGPSSLLKAVVLWENASVLDFFLQNIYLTNRFMKFTFLVKWRSIMLQSRKENFPQ